MIATNYLGGIWALRGLPAAPPEAGAPSDVVNVASVAGVYSVGGSGRTPPRSTRSSRSHAASRRSWHRGGSVPTPSIPGRCETEGFPQNRLQGTRTNDSSGARGGRRGDPPRGRARQARVRLRCLPDRRPSPGRAPGNARPVDVAPSPFQKFGVTWFGSVGVSLSGNRAIAAPATVEDVVVRRHEDDGGDERRVCRRQRAQTGLSLVSTMPAAVTTA